MKYIKKIVFSFIVTFVLINSVQGLSFDIQSKNAILYNVKEDEVLYEKASHEKVSIASLTKIMTAVIVLEEIPNLDEKVILKQSDFKDLIRQQAAQAGFRSNEVVSYRDLLYGLLLPSGAEAAQALVRLTTINKNEFIQKMNQKAIELGMTNTHFANEIGFDDKDHYSTVYDVSKLFKYALKNKEFEKIITSSKYTTSNGRLTLRSTASKSPIKIPHLYGSKTGTTNGAGLCLASIIQKGNTKLLLITTGAPYDKKGAHNFEDANKIYDYFLKNYGYQTILTEDDVIITITTKYAKEDAVAFYLDEKITLYLPNNINKKDIKYNYLVEEKITTSMKPGHKLGVVEIFYKDKKLRTVDIILKERVHFDIFKYAYDHLLIIFGVILIVGLFIGWKLIKRIH